MHRSFWAISLFLPLIAFTACSPGVRRAELLGEFKANFGAGTNSLLLRADGTYVRTFHSPGYQLVKMTNKWEFQNWHGRNMVALHGFADDPIFTPVTEAVWPATVERSWNGLKLVYDRDLGQAFVKPAEKKAVQH